MKKLFVFGMILMMLPLAFAAAKATTTASVRIIAMDNSGSGVMTASFGPVTVSPIQPIESKPIQPQPKLVLVNGNGSPGNLPIWLTTNTIGDSSIREDETGVYVNNKAYFAGDIKGNKVTSDQTSRGIGVLDGNKLALYAFHYTNPGNLFINVTGGDNGLGQIWTDRNLRIYSNGEIFLDAGTTYTEGYFYAKQGIYSGGVTDDVGISLFGVQNQTSNLINAYDENNTLKSWMTPDGRIYSNGDEVCTPSNHLCGAGFTGIVTLTPTKNCKMTYKDGRLLNTDC